MNVKDLMSEPVVTCRREDTLQFAAEAMRDQGVGILVVVDDEARVEGIVTDRDICLTACDLRESLEALRVEAAMTSTVLICAPDDTLTMAEDTMETNSVRRLVVIDDERRAIGLLSLDDIAVEALRERESGVERAEVTLAEVARVLGTIAQPTFRGGRPIPPGSEAMPRPSPLVPTVTPPGARDGQ
jgi:CBS domain-containing protein